MLLGWVGDSAWQRWGPGDLELNSCATKFSKHALDHVRTERAGRLHANVFVISGGAAKAPPAPASRDGEKGPHLSPGVLGGLSWNLREEFKTKATVTHKETIIAAGPS